MIHFWIAKWRTLNDTPKELVFVSQADYGIARLAFQLQCMERDIPCPNEFVLEKFQGNDDFRFPLTTPLKLAIPESVEL